MVIMRSSQPLTGPNGRRCKEDERMLNATLGIGRRGYIVDTRSPALTKLATARGEQTMCYVLEKCEKDTVYYLILFIVFYI